MTLVFVPWGRTDAEREREARRQFIDGAEREIRDWLAEWRFGVTAKPRNAALQIQADAAAEQFRAWLLERVLPETDRAKLEAGDPEQFMFAVDDLPFSDIRAYLMDEGFPPHMEDMFRDWLTG